MIIDYCMTAPINEWMSLREAQMSIPNSYLRGYIGTYSNVEGFFKLTTDDLILGMKKARVDKAVLQAEWLIGDYRKQNDAVYRLVQAHPDKFVAGYLTLNPLEDDDMVKVVEREVKERGFKGVNIVNFSCRLRANDKRFYPIYAKCTELNIPVVIQTSINFTVNRTMDYNRPIYLDEVACDFPDLIIIASHGGWPWVTEMVAIAWKHPNVYIDTSAISPKYIGTPGTGWEPLMVYGNSILQDRVLFATESMLPQKRCIDEIQALPLKERVKEKWLGENAARLLGFIRE